MAVRIRTKKNLIAVVLATAVLMSGGLSVAAEESGDVDDLVAALGREAA